MNDAKYIGLDVHQATISVAVLDSAGKSRERVLPSTASLLIPDRNPKDSFRKGSVLRAVN